jgi:uncharacterized protein
LIAVPILIVTIFSTIPVDTVINDVDAAFDHLSIENISGIIIVALTAVFAVIGLKIAEFFLIIYASLKASNGERYKYPLTIPFIK